MLASGGGEPIDMAKLRRLGLSSVWAFFAAFNVAYAVIIGKFNGGKPLMVPGGTYWRMSARRQLLFVLARAAVFGLPDLLSAALYFCLRRHFNKVNPAAAAEEEEGDDYYIAGAFPADGVPTGGEGFEPSPPPPPPPPPPPSQGGGHEANRVMRVLRLHVLTTLVDFGSVLSLFVPSSPLNVVLFYHSLLAVSFWLPLLMARANFQQMGGSLATLRTLLC